MGAANSEATWDAHAARYSSQERLEARAISAALRLAEPGPGDGLVDLATGTGAVLRALAQRRPRPATAVGVDRSANMLSRVGALPEDWRTVQGDAGRVPLPGTHVAIEELAEQEAEMLALLSRVAGAFQALNLPKTL